jgi:hypothetical protein
VEIIPVLDGVINVIIIKLLCFCNIISILI